jgi:PII-like signaling protein
MSSLMPFLLVGVGGFIGANARFVVARLVGALFETRFPLGTFIINISGSFLLGVLGTVAAQKVFPDSEAMRLALGVGFLGAFIGESDREPGRDRPLYEAIVRRAREAHLAGATVLRGPMGFGRHSRVHTAKLLELSTDLPILIEIVDSEEKVDAFLPTVDELVTEGLVTLEAVRIVRYVSPDSRP